MVTVIGTDLRPGTYTLGMGGPNSDLTVFNAYPAGTVGSEGRLEAHLAMPPGQGHCLELYARANDQSAVARPFVSSTANVTQPSLCEAMPNVPPPAYSSPLTIAPPNPKRGETVTVSGAISGLPSPAPPPLPDVRARLYFGTGSADLSSSPLSIRGDQIDLQFRPPDTPSLTGRCVELIVVPYPFQNFGYARFNWP